MSDSKLHSSYTYVVKSTVPGNEIIIVLTYAGDIFAWASYIHQKPWPCEDGIYCAPLYDAVFASLDALSRHIFSHASLDDKYTAKVCIALSYGMPLEIYQQVYPE